MPASLSCLAISLLYGAFASLTQSDTKRVVAYSSLSHLGLIVIAIASFNPTALQGAIIYIIAHGLFSAMLFLTLGFVESREDTRSLHRLGGLGAANPKLAGALALPRSRRWVFLASRDSLAKSSFSSDSIRPRLLGGRSCAHRDRACVGLYVAAVQRH